MDLPTYTNIWRIEKRLYKLYDFRLPAPVPITWIAVFTGITVPYVVFLIAVGLPFNHTLVWLYILPPGVLTWLSTRPVIENKKLPELISSQLRYVSEPRSWCRMVPSSEKDEVLVSVRVWRGYPPKLKTRKKAANKANKQKQQSVRPPVPSHVRPRRAAVAEQAVPMADVFSQPAPAQALLPQRATAQPPMQRTPSLRAVSQRAAGSPAQGRPAPEGPRLPEDLRGPRPWPVPPPVTPPGPVLAPPVAPPVMTPVAPPVMTPLTATGWEPRPAPLMGQPSAPAATEQPVPVPDTPPAPVPDTPPAPVPDTPPVPVPDTPPAPVPDTPPVPVPDTPPAPVPDTPPVPTPDAPPPAVADDPSAPAADDRTSLAVGALSSDTQADARLTAEADARLTAEAGTRPAGEPAEAGPGEQPAPVLEVSHDTVHGPAQADWYAAAHDLPSWSGPPLPPPQTRQQQARQQQARQPQTSQQPRRVSTRNTLASQPPQPSSAVPPPSSAARARIVDLDAERSLPSIERAISAPSGRRDFSWRRRVKVVAGGQGPGKRDQESLDRERARLALSGSRWIVVLGCGSGAGQTTTTLMTGRMLASLRQHPVAALTAATGTTRVASVSSLLNGRKPAGQGNGLEVIADDGSANAEEYQRLTGILGDRYPLTIVDHSPAGMSRVLNVADQLLIVVPANPEAASSLASTQQWLEANGYGNLAARAVTLVNGVRKDMMTDVLRAESVARGRCRAIVRVPWDDPAASLQAQTRVAYTALAGVLIAGLAAATAGGPAQERTSGEHQV